MNRFATLGLAGAAALALTLSAAAGPAGARPARAGSSVVVGGLGAALGCAVPAADTLFETAQGSGSASYVTPFAGVVTAFSYQANTFAGPVRALFFVPSSTAGHYTLVGKTPIFNAVASTVNSYQVRVPVPAGAAIAPRVYTASMACVATGAPGDRIAYGPFDPDASTDFAPGSPVAADFRPDLAVVLEPDADGDGYGDVTQDLCPQSALFHSANCPTPDTSVAKGPAKRGHQRKVSFSFASTVPGSTFQCRIDHDSYQPCSSNYKTKVLYGKHRLDVRAVSPASLVDPKPASYSFQVTRKPKKHHHH